MTELSGSSAGKVKLSTLGNVDLTAFDGGCADALLAQPKRFALLCYLAIPKPGTMIRRDTLVGVFWPEGDQEHTRTALRQALRFIRSTLGKDVILRRGAEEVGLDPALVWCDVDMFEQAVDAERWADAVELYRGELLKGFFLSRAQEFEHWLDAKRARLAGRYAHSLEELANSAEVSGNKRAAVEWWECLVRHDPFDSRFVAGLMDALERAGDPANALLFARKHRQLLRAELNISLPVEVKAMERRVRGEHSAKAVTDLPSESIAAQDNSVEEVPEAVQPVVEEESYKESARPRGSKLLRRFAPIGAAVILFGAAASAWPWSPEEASPAPSRPTITVFSLQNLGSSEDAVYAFGVTDALINRLSKISEFRITYGNETFNDVGLTLAEIEQVYGASHFLRGTFQREPGLEPDGLVRISVQLLEVSDGTCVWAEDFEVEFSDLFQMYGDIGGQVAAALNVTLLAEEQATLAERPSQNDSAYGLFLVANGYFEEAFPVRPELWDAVEWYEKAIAADSQFALAHAKLSMAHGGLYWGWRDRSEERLEKQRNSAETALRLQPGLPEGHLAMGIHYYFAHRNYGRALEELAPFKEQLATNYWSLVMTAAIQRRMGHFLEAAQLFAEASDLNPLAFSPAAEAEATYRNLRQYDEAHRFIDRYTATRPGRPAPYLRKALAYLEENGDVEKAREVLQSGPPSVPFDEMIAEAARYRCAFAHSRVVRTMCGDCLSALDRMARDTTSDDLWHYYMGKALVFERAGELSLERVYYDSSAALLEGLIRQQPEEEHFHADLGTVYAELGRKDAAIREATIAVNLTDPSSDAWYGYVPLRKRAEVYALVGEPDSAVADLESILSAFAAGPATGYYISPVAHVPFMRIDPIWDPIRDHPAFQALLTKYDPLR